MCKFDFVSMFWQIPLHEDSRRLFCFHAGDLGVFQFNRVAMGAMNSSIYTQRVMTMIFRHVHRKDGRCLLHNGLIIMTDDVLLYAKTQEEMVEILGLFMHTTCCHHLSCHPGKVGIMLKSTIFCGLKVTRQGITVDPDRLTGLMNVSPPRNLGDVWQFNAAVGWIREDIPLFSEASAVLSELVHKAIKPKTRRNMAAARRISLEQAGWTQRHQDAWDTIKRSMMQTITTAYRDKRMRACIFTDACDTGWAYAITQCREGELDKPWPEQKHELLAVNSGQFHNSQLHWHMGCKEAYPIRMSIERHRHLLEGNIPFASINDHKTLMWVFSKPSRKCTISVAHRDRLDRWAAYLRSFTFDTIHIPGDINHFCDLLSRQGCTTAAKTWANKPRTRHPTKTRPKSHIKVAQPQFAVIKPLGMNDTATMSNKDMDLHGADLMPTVLGKNGRAAEP